MDRRVKPGVTRRVGALGRSKFLPLRRGKRASRPLGKLVRSVVEPLGQAPVGQGVLTRAAGFFAARVGEGGAAFAVEIGTVAVVGFEIDHVAHHEAEHQAVGEDAGTREHAPHCHRAERREQVADEVVVHASAFNNSGASC
jgi:hypothetical protein